MRWKLSHFFTVLFCLAAEMAAALDVSLDGTWHFRDVATGVWYPAIVPGTVHTDLMAAGLIPNPYYGDNEQQVHWVENTDWQYQYDLSIPREMQEAKEYFLQFDGLDTWADVYVNDLLVLHADNMFRQWTIPLKELMKKVDKGSRRNTLRILFHSASRIAKDRKKAETIPYPDNERIYARKAQYQFGWDWGPRVVTAGIWRSVRLTTNPAPFAVSPQKPAWQLVTKDDSAGQAFYFSRNGKPVYIKGANWIPLDNFIPRAVKSGRYEQVIRDAKEAGINMLRVWGGGIYEDDLFYDLCDKYGIAVWQDFMFAGAMYPGDSAFLKNVEEEVRYQVQRLRRHPCIALWCGNNEIDEAWHNWGWQEALNYSKAGSARLWRDYQTLFHQLIPGILKELDPARSYWPSSPSTGWGRDEAYKRGDVHYWGVWWGREPVSAYKKKVGRFNSEYGMQAFPDIETIKAFSQPGDWDTASAVMRAHQKHPFGYQNIGMYVGQRFRTPKTFEDLVYVSGLMQADAIGTAIGAHRGAKPYNMGTMYWQLDDCWPAVSWSSIDYYGRKKPLHYRLKELYAPVLLVADTDADMLRVRISSDTDLIAPLHLRVFAAHLSGSNTTWMDTTISDLTISDSVAQMFRFPLPPAVKAASRRCYIAAILSAGDREIASTTLLLHPPKDMLLPAGPILSWELRNAQCITVSATAFAYGVRIKAPPGVGLSDNYFNLRPGQAQFIYLDKPVTWGAISISSLADVR